MKKEEVIQWLRISSLSPIFLSSIVFKSYLLFNWHSSRKEEKWSSLCNLARKWLEGKGNGFRVYMPSYPWKVIVSWEVNLARADTFLMQHYHLPHATMNYIPCGKSPFLSNIANVPRPFLGLMMRCSMRCYLAR